MVASKKDLQTKENKEFSKFLLLQESIPIWIISISFILMAFIAIWKGYLGSLPWLTAMVSCPWAAYGVSQAFYYNKSKAENTINGIKYDRMIKEQEQRIMQSYRSASNAESTPSQYIGVDMSFSAQDPDPWGPI